MIQEVFPYLCVDNAKDAIEFYKTVFGATETLRLSEPSGRVGHAQLDLGGTTVMLAEEFPELGIRSPKSIGGTPVRIHLHVDNADELIAQAIKAGATLEREPEDQFYGERSGSFEDPFGHKWLIGHHIEDVSYEEMQRRYTAMFEGQ